MSSLLPTPEETLLLRVCLADRETSRSAWHWWYDPTSRSGKSLLKNPSVKKLRPLLSNAVQIHGLEVDKEGLTFLRTAYFKEDLRSSAFRHICGAVLLLLEKEEFVPTVLKGTALAETVYPNPVLRHCHDIDILLPDDELSHAANLLPSLGFQRIDPSTQARNPHVRMEHESELPLELHSGLFEIPYYNVVSSEIQARSQSRLIADIPVKILAPSDSLLHVCGHASYSKSRQSLRWSYNQKEWK